MRRIEIPKITINAFKVFGNEKLEAELERQEEAVETIWEGIYNAIESGKSDMAYWDDNPVERPGYHSFMRYALHRSVKQDGHLQVSVMEIRNGEMIPTSDSQHNSAFDFIRNRVWGCRAETVMVM